LEVTAPPGNIIGYVSLERSFFSAKYLVQNASGEIVFRIVYSPRMFVWECLILSSDGSVQVGKITGQQQGLFSAGNHLLIQNMTSLLISIIF
jgi:ABC-type microcin C transport system permease subunit YejE